MVEFCDIFESDACGIAFTASGEDDAFVTLVGLGRKRDSGTLIGIVSRRFGRDTERRRELMKQSACRRKIKESRRLRRGETYG